LIILVLLNLNLLLNDAIFIEIIQEFNESKA